MRKSLQGITLIELMVVLVVLGIVITLAYPNYREFAARAKRNEARAALLQIATNQERFYLNNNQYTTDLTELGFAATPVFTTETGSYNVTVTAANATTYTATATFLLGGNEAGTCGLFQINAAGVKTSGPQPDCWERAR